MFITAVSVRGFADLAHFDLSSLDRIVHLQGPDPSCTALGDAIELAFAALSEARLKRLLNRWELLAPGEEPEISGDPFPEQATWSDTQSARTLLPPGPERHLQVNWKSNVTPFCTAHRPNPLENHDWSSDYPMEDESLWESALYSPIVLMPSPSTQRFEIGGQSFRSMEATGLRITRFLRLLVGDFIVLIPSNQWPGPRWMRHFRNQFTAYQSWQNSLGSQQHFGRRRVRVVTQ